MKEYKADLTSLKEQLKQAAAGTSDGDAARAELGLGDNYYSTSGRVGSKGGMAGNAKGALWSQTAHGTDRTLWAAPATYAAALNL